MREVFSLSIDIIFHAVRAITPVVPLIPTFIASEGSLIVSSDMTPTISDQVTNPLAVCALYSAQAVVVKLALVAQCIMTNSLNARIPPRQSTAKQSASGKINLAHNGAIAYVEYVFHFLKPLSQTNDSFSTLEFKGLTVQEFLVCALTSSALSSSFATS
nr:hypothetical protein [Tanacetum cinerariifolium]